MNHNHVVTPLPCMLDAVAYPELVSGGVSKSGKCKWLVEVGANKGVTA